jgi:hypothetical protein
MNVTDIEGTKAKPLYSGIAKDIINHRDRGTLVPTHKVFLLILSLQQHFVGYTIK